MSPPLSEPALDWSKMFDEREARARRAAATLDGATDPREALRRWDLSPWRIEAGSTLHDAAIDALIAHARHLPGTLADLSLLGDRVEALERQGWELPAREADGALRRAWAAWFDRDFWTHRELWEKTHLQTALEATRAVARQRALPGGALRRVLADLVDNFYLVLLGDGAGVPGWLDVALMVVERAPEGPVTGLASCLDAEGWARLGACLRRRGAWPATLRAAGARPLPESPGALEALLDLHTLRRVLATTTTATGLDLGRAWRITRVNRGRMRGRLRALLSERPRETARARVLGHPALGQATAEAFARFWLSQAWQELRRDFSFDGRDLVTPPCVAPEDEPAEAEPLDEDALQTWVLLVILRGRWEHLQRWAEEGSTGDRDSTWGRLLSDALPRGLGGGRAGHRAVREHLSLSLGELLTSLLPRLEALARIPSGPGLEDAARRLLAEGWHPDVPAPSRGFKKMVENAAALLSGGPVTEEEPWIQPETSS